MKDKDTKKLSLIYENIEQNEAEYFNNLKTHAAGGGGGPIGMLKIIFDKKLNQREKEHSLISLLSGIEYITGQEEESIRKKWDNDNILILSDVVIYGDDNHSDSTVYMLKEYYKKDMPNINIKIKSMLYNYKSWKEFADEFNERERRGEINYMTPDKLTPDMAELNKLKINKNKNI